MEDIMREIIERMELLRRDDNPFGTLEEKAYKHISGEAANDMLDDCIAIVKEVFNG